MRVFIVSCVYSPEPVVSAQTSTEISEELSLRGHDVTVITAFPNRPAGKLYAGVKRQLVQSQNIRPGFELIRCFSTLSPDSRLLSRFLENVSFGMTSSAVILFSKQPDVIYANTWPIFAGVILYLVSRIRRIPYVISVQDIYPESLIIQKRISRKSWLSKLMRGIDGIYARGARAVVVISERFAKIYRDDRRVLVDRLFVIPNWAVGNSSPTQSGNVRQEQRISPAAFLLAYGGNVGVAAGVESIIESFRFLADCRNLHLLVAGAGSRLSACQNLAQSVSGARISFYSPWPVDQTDALYEASDVLILPTLGEQSLVSVPSKLVAYMMAERPVIALAVPDSDVAEIIRESGCGWLADPGSPEALATLIRRISKLDRAELKERGKLGRNYALGHWTRESCLPRLLSLIEAPTVK